MTHTPGPWHIDWNGGMAPRIIGVYAPGLTRGIADVLFHNGSDDPQVHDNARLIAAAPEMLAALENIAEWVGGMCSCRADDEYHNRLFAVIAKAKTSP